MKRIKSCRVANENSQLCFNCVQVTFKPEHPLQNQLLQALLGCMVINFTGPLEQVYSILYTMV